MNSTEGEPSYFIDLKWYEEKGRSFFTLARSRLCPSCQAKYPSAPKTDAKLFTAFRNCCSNLASDYVVVKTSHSINMGLHPQ